MRRALPILILFALAATVAAWFVISNDRPAAAAVRNTVESARCAAPRVIGVEPADTPKNAPRQAPACSAGQELERDEPKTTPDPQPFVDDDPLVAEQPLYTPDLGPLVRRSDSRVEFEVLDAKGQELEGSGAPTEFQLWRKLGRYWTPEAAHYDDTRRLFVCDGSGGLEPGEYELRASYGVYGLVSRQFRISRGETRRERLQTPRWRRIIALRFVDADGGAVPFLTNAPWTKPTAAVFERDDRGAPGRILRDPPSPNGGGRGGRGGFAYRRARGTGEKVARRYPTDDGCWYLRVFSGAQDSVGVTLDEEIFGSREWAVTSDFVGPEWDNYIIKLHLTPDYTQKMEVRKLTAEESPGNRALLTAPTNPPLPPVQDPYDLAGLQEGWQRLVVSLSAPVAITPVVKVEPDISQPKDKNPGPQVAKLDYSEKHNVWWLDLEPDSGAWVEFSTPALMLAHDDLSERVELGTQRLVEYRRALDCVMLKIPAATPTLNALGVDCACTLAGKLDLSGTALTAPDGSRKIFVPKAVVLALGENVSGSVRLCEDDKFGNTGATRHFSLTKEQLAELALGGTTVKPDAGGLVLRVVGPGLEGLPWTEASLICSDDDIAAKRARQVWLASLQQGDGAMHECYRRLGEEGSAEESPELKALLERFKDPQARAFMRTHGAWYNTSQKLNSNHAGYMCSDQMLVAGKHYVLYLWSNSRDELQPDRRIDFIAGEGMTDLGVVTLPGYSD